MMNDSPGSLGGAASTAAPAALRDRFGRLHDSLRVSVTDRCNIRCFYCMPEHDAVFMPKASLLSFEEIVRIVDLMVRRFGVRDVRLTGGEPLVRRGLPDLIEMIAGIDGIDDLSMTTNGILLAQHAKALRAAGLKRINISLDTLSEATFQKISRRSGLDRVLAGIDAAIGVGFDSIKLNALAIRGVTENEVAGLIDFAISKRCSLRFIEFMPLDSDRAWNRQGLLTGDQLLTLIRQSHGDLMPIDRDHPSQPAEQFRLPSGATLGLIRSVTRPFCESCNRLRLTADGSLRNCLFAQTETPLRDRLRDGQSDDQLAQQIIDCVAAKHAAHGIDADQFRPPDRAMYSIGG